MSSDIEVHIQIGHDTHRVGTLHHHQRGRSESSSFHYEDSWRTNPAAFALSPSLSLIAGEHHISSEQGSLPGAIRDGAPDRWGRTLILRSAAKDERSKPVTEVDFLVGLDDETRIGALRYKYVGEDNFLRPDRDRRLPPILSLSRLMNAADAVQSQTESVDDLTHLLGDGSPLGGARPKSVVVDTDGSLAIAKFPKADDIRNIAAGELLMSRLASMAGIRTCETHLVKVANRPISIVRRFDRNDDGGRVHFISAKTILNIGDKAEGSYADIAMAIRQYSEWPIEDCHELFRRVAFNILASNFDDHLRNHGFLFNPKTGKWRLSPAYDMNPVPISEKQRELTTWIDERGPEASLAQLMNARDMFLVDEQDAHNTIAEIAEVTSQWMKIGSEIGLRSSELEPYKTAFEHDELKQVPSTTVRTP